MAEKDTKNCPFCGGEIKNEAKKCKHCGKWLNESQDKQEEEKPQTKNCPACGEEILAEARKCKHCGEWLDNENKKQEIKIAPDIIPLLKNIFIGICVVVVFVICQNLFMNPFEELVRGCKSDGETTYPLGTNIIDTQAYFCKDKPWVRVWKNKSHFSNHYTYNLYTKNNEGNEELRAKIYWSQGDYHCEIRSEIYLDNNNLWGGNINRKYDILYDDICTPKEFVKLAKKYLKKNFNKEITTGTKTEKETVNNNENNNAYYNEDTYNKKTKPSDYHFGTSYEQAIQDKTKPMIILFYVDWDGYSLGFMPVYEGLYKNHKNQFNFVKINVEDEKYSNLVEKYKIEGFPTVFMVNTTTNEREQLKNENFRNMDKLNKLMNDFYNKMPKNNSNIIKNESQNNYSTKKPSDYHFGVSYEQAIKDGTKPMIILFYADWCQYSQRFMPIYETMYEREKKYYNFVKINVDNKKYLDLAKKYNIEALPTVFLVNTNTDEREQLENKDFGDISLLYNTMTQFATHNGY